jgi:hypothetical protein
MARRGYKRRKVVVDRKMQIGLSVTVIVVLSCYLLLFCLIAVYSPFATLLTGRRRKSGSSTRRTRSPTSSSTSCCRSG